MNRSEGGQPWRKVATKTPEDRNVYKRQTKQDDCKLNRDNLVLEKGERKALVQEGHEILCVQDPRVTRSDTCQTIAHYEHHNYISIVKIRNKRVGL